MSSREHFPRVRVTLEPKAYERLQSLAEVRGMTVQNYSRLILEGHEGDFLAYHAFTASRFSVMAAMITSLVYQAQMGKPYSDPVLQWMNDQMMHIVGDGPGRPSVPAPENFAERNEFVRAIIEALTKSVGDQFGAPGAKVGTR